MALVVGITGGVATGKTTVLALFRELGAQTLSADEIAKEVLKKGSRQYTEVVHRFGERILKPDGEVDRKALGEIVFRDPRARQILNNITHPRIIRLLKSQINMFKKQHASDRHAVLVVEIPLLFECGLEDLVDTVVVVAAEQRTQMNRLTSVWGLSEEQAVLRIQAQMPIEEKLKRADHVIWNNDDLNSLKDSVERVHREILLL